MELAAAETGELVFGETVDADAVLPSTADDDFIEFLVGGVALHRPGRCRADTKRDGLRR
ncbi:hypothetical protein IU459_27675 [Nocardia amamiensis]|uniref:Uncharacterized protein n=1 Tax=Nocardia amamiensis TaxID=404578 RepID=A0ABS0CZK7_9NOCA|nr:hypothetical protein [Nocardia amamiensis]MBF6301293.1 hypothetical protein [Nocardia amamiensis]